MTTWRHDKQNKRERIIKSYEIWEYFLYSFKFFFALTTRNPDNRIILCYITSHTFSIEKSTHAEEWRSNNNNKKNLICLFFCLSKIFFCLTWCSPEWFFAISLFHCWILLLSYWRWNETRLHVVILIIWCFLILTKGL